MLTGPAGAAAGLATAGASVGLAGAAGAVVGAAAGLGASVGLAGAAVGAAAPPQAAITAALPRAPSAPTRRRKLRRPSMLAIFPSFPSLSPWPRPAGGSRPAPVGQGLVPCRRAGSEHPRSRPIDRLVAVLEASTLQQRPVRSGRGSRRAAGRGPRAPAGRRAGGARPRAAPDRGADLPPAGLAAARPGAAWRARPRRRARGGRDRGGRARLAGAWRAPT